MRVTGLVLLAAGCAAGQGSGSNFHVRELELPLVVLVLEGPVTAEADPIDRRWLASPPIRSKAKVEAEGEGYGYEFGDDPLGTPGEEAGPNRVLDCETEDRCSITYVLEREKETFAPCLGRAGSRSFVVHARIRPDGRPEHVVATITGDTGEDACVIASFERLQFASSQDDVSTKLTVPIRLERRK